MIVPNPAPVLIGPDIAVTVDANHSMTADDAIAAAAAFKPFDILWIQHPTTLDDDDGVARIAKTTGMPPAIGAQLHAAQTLEVARRPACRFCIQPDASIRRGAIDERPRPIGAHARRAPVVQDRMAVAQGAGDV
jgi:L-alanine-DL-glutamate epimerase-like enolase superfamily enzyme